MKSIRPIGTRSVTLPCPARATGGAAAAAERPAQWVARPYRCPQAGAPTPRPGGGQGPNRPLPSSPWPWRRPGATDSLEQPFRPASHAPPAPLLLRRRRGPAAGWRGPVCGQCYAPATAPASVAPDAATSSTLAADKQAGKRKEVRVSINSFKPIKTHYKHIYNLRPILKRFMYVLKSLRISGF